MKKITVALEERSYSINIAAGLLNESGIFWPLKAGNQAMLVTNETLAPIYLTTLRQKLENIGIKVDQVILADGEQYKTLAAIDQIFTALLQNYHGRDTTLIALGGGVIGDLTGFAAASYQRGVRFIHVPTTLLSQVDSSIGGKTAVNHKFYKNIIGAFYQPSSVIIDLNYLQSLPLRELASGMAEVIKYGIILDSEFFYWLEQNIDALMALDNIAMTYCVHRCCKLKSEVVVEDEREIGIRTLLNLGHTYGHAIEAYMGYNNNWLHGEAIAVGMVMAAYTAERLGEFSTNETKRIINLLKRVGLPVHGPDGMIAQDYFSRMLYDKKVLDGKLRLVLPLAIGKAKVYSNIAHDIIFTAIEDSYKL